MKGSSLHVLPHWLLIHLLVGHLLMYYLNLFVVSEPINN